MKIEHIVTILYIIDIDQVLSWYVCDMSDLTGIHICGKIVTK